MMPPKLLNSELPQLHLLYRNVPIIHPTCVLRPDIIDGAVDGLGDPCMAVDCDCSWIGAAFQLEGELQIWTVLDEITL